MDRVFLDSNVLFSAAYRTDAIHLELWGLKKTELITSSYALAEAHGNLDGPEPRGRLKKLTESLRMVSIHPDLILPEGITLPEKDRPILQAAISVHATHLLTGDTHFRKYFRTQIAGVLILTPAEYLRLRQCR